MRWGDLAPTLTFLHGVPAWLLSLILHAALLMTLALLVRVTYRGAALEPARGGGIVLAREADGEAEYFGEGDADTSPNAADTQDSQTAQQGALPNEQELPVDLAGALPEAASGNDGSDVRNALPSASGFTTGSRPSGGRVDGNRRAPACSEPKGPATSSSMSSIGPPAWMAIRGAPWRRPSQN